jgi:uncharacterized protein DUF4129
VLPAVLPALLAVDVPVRLGRDEARDAARRELADPAYHAHEPSLLERGVRWVIEQVGRLLDRASEATPGGWWSLLVLLGVAALVVIVVRHRVGPLARTTRSDKPIFVGPSRTSADHRRAAAAALARGEVAEAVRERFRAVVRSLEERGMLDPRPGRTADEAARDGAALLPDCAEGLWTAARLFDEVWYGGRAATEAAYQRIAAVDDQVGAAELKLREPR